MKKFLSCILASVLAFGVTSCSIFGGKGGEDSQSDVSSSIEETSGSISFVNSELNMEIGESVQAEVTTSKKNVYIFWSIRDKEIAKVDSKGVITALAAGETVCYAEFGGVKAICQINVLPKSAQPLLSVTVPYPNELTLYTGGTLALKPSVKLGDDTVEGAQISYVLTGVDVVKVEDGVITALCVGTATISIQASYNNQTASLLLTVTVVDSLPSE
jgi:hypothetical protein